MISNSFYRKVYYPMDHSNIQRQFCLFINSLRSLSGFICIILHYCNSSVLGVFANCETRLLASSYSVSVSLFTWNNSAPIRQVLMKSDIWGFLKIYRENYRDWWVQSKLRNVLEEQRSHLHRSWSQKSRENSSLIKIWQK